MPTEHDPRRNVVLTGFMGTGKTTVGRLLADRLRYEFVDTDAVIEERHGPIPAIFRDSGEAGFRRHERDVADELADRAGLVISTGGGMLVDDHNAAVLGRTGDLFCLTASVDTILARVTADDTTSERPLLAADDVHRRITELLADRAETYRRFRRIDTDGRSPRAVADEIVRLVTHHPA